MGAKQSSSRQGKQPSLASYQPTDNAGVISCVESKEGSASREDRERFVICSAAPGPCGLYELVLPPRGQPRSKQQQDGEEVMSVKAQSDKLQLSLVLRATLESSAWNARPINLFRGNPFFLAPELLRQKVLPLSSPSAPTAKSPAKDRAAVLNDDTDCVSVNIYHIDYRTWRVRTVLRHVPGADISAVSPFAVFLDIRTQPRVLPSMTSKNVVGKENDSVTVCAFDRHKVRPTLWQVC
jgi:hypothetical protein